MRCDRLGVLALLACAGCIVPELDTPPLPRVEAPVDAVAAKPVPKVVGTTPLPCKPGTFQGSVTLDGKAPFGYGDQCIVSGSVTVTDKATIGQIDALRAVVEIKGKLVLKDGVADAGVFPSLQRIGAGLEVKGSGLQVLGGFQKLQEVKGDLVVEGNPALTHIDGFGALTLAVHLKVNENPQLAKVTAFAQLGKTSGVQFVANPALVALQPMPALAQITGSLFIREVGLAQVAAWPALTSLQSLDVTDNAQLVALDLPGLVTASQLYLVDNPALASLAGMPKLGKVAILQICGNAKLDPAEVDAFAQAHTDPAVPGSRVKCQP